MAGEVISTPCTVEGLVGRKAEPKILIQETYRGKAGERDWRFRKRECIQRETHGNQGRREWRSPWQIKIYWRDFHDSCS